MPARVVEVCKAIEAYVIQEQKAGTYGFAFNVKYANPAYHRLESTIRTWLFVYPGPEGPTNATRNKWQHTYNATIHLVNYVDGVIPQEEIDDLMFLMERIVDSLKVTRMAGMALVEFSTEDNPEVPLVDDAVRTLNLAQSVRRATYSELR